MEVVIRKGVQNCVGVIFGIVPKSAGCTSWHGALVGGAHKSVQMENKLPSPVSRRLYQQY